MQNIRKRGSGQRRTVQPFLIGEPWKQDFTPMLFRDSKSLASLAYKLLQDGVHFNTATATAMIAAIAAVIAMPTANRARFSACLILGSANQGLLQERVHG